MKIFSLKVNVEEEENEETPQNHNVRFVVKLVANCFYRFDQHYQGTNSYQGNTNGQRNANQMTAIVATQR